MVLLNRRAVDADAAKACDLVRRSITELCIADHQGDKATVAEWLANKTEANFARWIASPLHAAIVAEKGGTIVGFALLNRAGTITLLYVAPEARFQRVSKKLLRAVEDYAAAWDIDLLKLESSITALSFYERHGFSRAGPAARGFGVSHAYPLHKQVRPSFPH